MHLTFDIRWLYEIPKINTTILILCRKRFVYWTGFSAKIYTRLCT